MMVLDLGSPPSRIYYALDPLQASVVIAIFSMFESTSCALFTGFLYYFFRDTSALESCTILVSNIADSILGVSILIYVTSLACEIPLLLAALKHKKILMLPWLVKTSLGFVLWPAFIIFLIVYVPISAKAIAIISVLILLGMCMSLRMWFAVKRCFSTM